MVDASTDGGSVAAYRRAAMNADTRALTAESAKQHADGAAGRLQSAIAASRNSEQPEVVLEAAGMAEAQALVSIAKSLAVIVDVVLEAVPTYEQQEAAESIVRSKRQ
jgi:hypothetical protein